MASSLQNMFKPSSPFMQKLASAMYSRESRVRLYRKLSALLSNGKRLQSSIEDLMRRAQRRSSTDPEAIILSFVARELTEGRGFSDSIAKFVTPNEAMILRSGEQAGKLAESLILAAETLESQKLLRQTVLGAIAQPLLTLAIVFVALYIIGQQVVPKMAAALDPELWTGVGYSLYLASKITDSILFYVIIFGCIATLLLIWRTLPYWKGAIRVKLDRLPPWSFYRLLIGGGWLVSLAALIQSGATLVDSIRQLRDHSDPWLKERLSSTLFHLNSGKNLGQALDASKMEFPDRELIDDLVSYADLPDFANVLYRVGKSWVNDGLLRIQEQAKILNTVSMLIIGVIIAWFAYGTIDLQSQIAEHFSRLGSGF